MAVATAEAVLAPAAAQSLRGWLAVVLGGTVGRVGAFFILLTVAVAFLGPLVAPYSPTALGPPVQQPSGAHWLGTDQLGRDVLSRVLNGGQLILVLPLLAVLLAFSIGATLGLLAGYKGGLVDTIIVRVADVVMSMPPLLLLLVFVITLGGSNLVIVMLVGLVFAPRVARIIRGATHWVTTQDYVIAARARGESTFVILRREILPNITGPLLTEMALRVNNAIIFIATLNFLGLGVQPPSSDWGLMVSEGGILLGQQPLVSLAPAVLIALLSIGVNLVSDEIASHLARNVHLDTRL